MMSLCRFIGGALAGALLFSNVAAFAAGPLDLVPKDAAIVGRLKVPQSTLEKVGNFVNQGAPGFGFVVLSQANQMGALISNTTLGGVELKQDWYFAAFIEKNAAPSVVFIVPTNDEAALKEAVGNNFTYVTADNWVAYSEDAAAAELIAACKSGKTKSISTTIDKRANSLFDDSDVSIHVNIAKLRSTYAEELLSADKQLDDGIEGLKALTAGAAQPGMNVGAIWEMYGKLGHNLLQGARDSDSLSIGIKVSNEALTIDELLVVGKGSDSDKFLQSHPTSDLSLIAKQPQSQFAYFAAHGDASALMKWSLDMSRSMFADNADMKAKMEALQKDFSAIKIGAVAGSFGLNSPGPEGIVNGVIAMEVNPALKMRELSRKAMAELKIEVPGVKQEHKSKLDAEKVGDLTVDVVTTTQEYGDDLPGVEAQKKIIEVAYGKEGITQRIANTSDTYLQTIGGGAEGMKLAIAAIKDPAPAKPTAVAKSRSRQLEKANLLFMIDLPNLALKGAVIADELSKAGTVPPLGAQIPVAQLKGLKLDSSFVTFAVGTEPEGVRLRTEVPSSTVSGFFKIFQTVTTAGRGARGGAQ